MPNSVRHFGLLFQKGLIKQLCKETEDQIEICVHAVNVKASNMTYDNNLLWIFSCQKKINAVSTVNLFSGTIVIKRGNLHFEWCKDNTHHSYLSYPLPICNSQRWELSPFSVWFWSVPQIQRVILTCFTFRQIFIMVYCLNMPHILLFMWLLKNPFHTDRWMLLKHIYRVGRAANH